MGTPRHASPSFHSPSTVGTSASSPAALTATPGTLNNTTSRFKIWKRTWLLYPVFKGPPPPFLLLLQHPSPPPPPVQQDPLPRLPRPLGPSSGRGRGRGRRPRGRRGPGPTNRRNQEDMRRQLDLLAEDARQHTRNRRILYITHTNTVTTVYKDNGKPPTVRRTCSRITNP